MIVLDIIINYLKENGYDGLYHNGECGCELGDICPCEEIQLDCRPGYRVDSPVDHEYNWYICKSKDAEPWND